MNGRRRETRARDDDPWTRRARPRHAIVTVAVALLAAGMLLGACAQRDDEPATHAVCADSRDNDNDGATDYPHDPECSSSEDVAEKT